MEPIKDEKLTVHSTTPHTSGGYKNVQTFAGDMANVIEGDRGGLIKKIIHGEQEKDAEKKYTSPEAKKNRILLGLSLILIAISVSVLAYFFIFQKKITTVPVAEQFVPLIFNDRNAFLEVKGMTRDEMTQTVLGEINGSTVKTGGVEGIYLTEDTKIIGLRRFLTLIKSNFTPGNPAFIYDNFLFGIFNNQDLADTVSEKDFFILIKVRSLPDIFEPLRTWEDKMFTDLHGFFGMDVNASTKDLLTKDFEDGIVGNKNARILYDKDQKIVMMYILADDNSIIITNTSRAASELMLRLASGEIKK